MKEILIGLSGLLLLFACQNEPEEELLPIEVSSAITNVSIFGASDGTITLTVTGGTGTYTYAWSNGAITKDLSAVAAGTYSVTVTDSEDNSETHSATVSEPTELLLDYEKVDESEVGAGDGSISLLITGGTQPYAIVWSHGPADVELTGLTAGIYSVNVTDFAGAEKSLDIEILAPLKLSFTIGDAGGYDQTDGAIDMTIAGGQVPFTITWSDGSTGEDLSGIGAGFYQVTVTDNLGAQKKSSMTVYEPYDKVSPEAELLENIVRLTQSGMRIQAGETVIYIDPINLMGGVTGDADIILITHNHSDHFNAGIIGQLAHAGTIILVPLPCYAGSVSAAPSSEVLEVAADSVKTVEGIVIETVRAYNSNHTSGCVGYILNIDGLRVYHSGDTGRLPEMTGFNADIAMLPLGQTYTFANLEESANSARDVGATVVLPMHYGMYEGTNANPWALKDMLEGEIDVAVKPSVIN
jgi:L-ascorbate metabolism protein UlaG (beta-lactamase superfamily)